MYSQEDILNTRKFSPETFILLSRMVDVIVNQRLNEDKIKKLELRTALVQLLGISDHAAKKAISIFNKRSEASEKRPMGRPGRSLEPESISALKDMVKEKNQGGQVITFRCLITSLEQEKGIKITYRVLLKDLHRLSLSYKKGERRNILHDSPFQHWVSFQVTQLKEFRTWMVSTKPIMSWSICWWVILSSWPTRWKNLGTSWRSREWERKKANDGYVWRIHCI